ISRHGITSRSGRLWARRSPRSRGCAGQGNPLHTVSEPRASPLSPRGRADMRSMWEHCRCVNVEVMTMSYYERLLTVLRDGDWHDESELRKEIYYTQDWLRELRLEGKYVDQLERDGRTWVRLSRQS